VKPITATEVKESWKTPEWRQAEKKGMEIWDRVMDGFLTTILNTIKEIKLPKVHDLKIWPQFFKPVSEGRANFQFRKNDRDYQEGDTLRLREWDQTIEEPYGPGEGGKYKGYTGREVLVKVDYIMRVFDFGEWPPPVLADYVIMGTSLVKA
jgi:hypothetical protein